MFKNAVSHRTKKDADFLKWYDIFLDAMRNGFKYKGALDMEAAKQAYEERSSPTEYAENLYNELKD